MTPQEIFAYCQLMDLNSGFMRKCHFGQDGIPSSSMLQESVMKWYWVSALVILSGCMHLFLVVPGLILTFFEMHWLVS